MLRASKLWMVLSLAVFAGCENLDAVGPDPANFEDLGALLSSATEDGPVVSATADTTTTDRTRRDRDHDRRRHDARSIFNQLARAIPSFGGLYRIEPCVVGLVLTDMSEADRAVQIVKEKIEPLAARPCPNGIRVDAVQGTYTYTQLMRIRHALRPLASIRGVLGAHIDFKANQVIVGVANSEVAGEVRAALARIDVPEGSVEVVVRGGRG